MDPLIGLLFFVVFSAFVKHRSLNNDEVKQVSSKSFVAHNSRVKKSDEHLRMSALTAGKQHVDIYFTHLCITSVMCGLIALAVPRYEALVYLFPDSQIAASCFNQTMFPLSILCYVKYKVNN